MTIKPQISGEDSIRLVINQESSQVSSESVPTTDAITTFTRAKTSVVVLMINQYWRLLMKRTKIDKILVLEIYH